MATTDSAHGFIATPAETLTLFKRELFIVAGALSILVQAKGVALNEDVAFAHAAVTAVIREWGHDTGLDLQAEWEAVRPEIEARLTGNLTPVTRDEAATFVAMHQTPAGRAV